MGSLAASRMWRVQVDPLSPGFSPSLFMAGLQGASRFPMFPMVPMFSNPYLSIFHICIIYIYIYTSVGIFFNLKRDVF